MPTDRFGNLVGPGLGHDLAVTGIPGSDPTGNLVDDGNGTYGVDGTHDPSGGSPPGVAVTLPGRPSVCLTESNGPRLPAENRAPWWMWLLVVILLLTIIVLLIM